ncbi:MAG: hypothetical protein IT314_03805 [Anaerolineales bacterium]|nr:hypothetical protein [Anaerolineales bacterium]
MRVEEFNPSDHCAFRLPLVNRGLYRGEIVATLDRKDAPRERLSLSMAGVSEPA